MMQLIQRVKAILLTHRMAGDRARAGIAVHLVRQLCADPGGNPGDLPLRRPIADRRLYADPLGLLRAVIVYVATFAVVYLIACVIDLLAPRFGAQKNFDNALKLTVYSYTPVWLAGIFLLIPGLNFLVILGLYGIYLLWRGLPVLMRAPDDRVLAYTAVVTACALVPAIVLVMI